jgi:diadenosine tetraphosphate (Ap4A) HIT family hydrolase
MFELHPHLAQDTLVVGDFPLSRLLMMNDANYPWFILVPRRTGMREIFELADDDQHQLLQESSRLAMVLYRQFKADKLNIAALGNMVPQLHIHHIVRYRSDPAWPQPVWGLFPAQPYPPGAMQEICTNLVGHLPGFVTDASGAVAPGFG